MTGKVVVLGGEKANVGEETKLAPQIGVLQSLARTTSIEKVRFSDSIASDDESEPASKPNQDSLTSFLCFKPFTTMEIHTDGNCTFCCFIRSKIGNIMGENIEAVFNSEKAQEIRKKFYQHDYSDCDKSRCSLFTDDKKKYQDNIPTTDPLYRKDIHNSIAKLNTIIENGPSKVVESAHGLCNVKCKFCWPFTRYSQLSYRNETYRLILNSLQRKESFFKQVYLAGGEPFFNPLIDTLLLKLINKKLSLGVTSNLTCLMNTTKQLLDKINLVYLNASINAASKVVYDQLVQGGDWEKVCENLSFFKNMRETRPSFNFGISMVVNKINCHEIPDFLDFGINRYSVDTIVLHPPDETHMPDALKLTVSEAHEIREMLALPIFSQFSSKIYSCGLRKYIFDLITQYTEREKQMQAIDINVIITHLTQDEKHKLKELATATRGSTYVELGSYLGASSCFIASGIQSAGNLAKLYCVDTWANEGMAEGSRDTYGDFLENTTAFKDIIVPLRGKSENIARNFDQEIDFIFIDAGHDYQNVKTDVLAWFPKLRPGAQVIFHDIGWAEGVQQVVREYVQPFAHDEGSLPNMYWACISQSGNHVSEETFSSLNQQREPNNLIQRLLDLKVPVEKIDLDVEDFISWLSDYSEIHERYSRSNDVFIEKCLEHYIAFKLSALEPGQIYVDIAAAGSNWSDCLRKRGVNAYNLDLTYPEGIHGNKIGANAATTGLPDNSVDAMSLQCAFETFRGNYDKLYVKESERILKDGGKVVISPLYLDASHFILSSKNSDLSSVPLDEGAIRVWREDEYDEAFSRHYSPEALANRIFSNLNGLSAKVIYISNLDQFRHRFPGQRIYCDFNLYISKIAKPVTVKKDGHLSGIYDETFYDEQKDASYKSAESVVPILVDMFNPKSVIDIGCGVGGWLHVFQKNCVTDICGYDVNELRADKYFIDKDRIKTNADLSNLNFRIDEKADLLICLEVAEHLPAEVADQFVLNLANASPVVIFSAALPGQTGVNHINEQPPWYWREKFNKIGYVEMDFIRPQILRNDDICWWYRQNITCFVRPSMLTTNPRLAALATLHGQRNDAHKLTIVNEWVLRHILNGDNLTLSSVEQRDEVKQFLTVIIPTRNRAALLYNTLESLTSQTYPADSFEVIVVDNGSTDSTAEVCSHFERRIPQFKRIYDPRPGLHNGRHTGLEAASGNILVYGDDDIEATQTWLEGIAESFADPSVALVGGKILPKFETPPPEWIDRLSGRVDSGWSLGWYSLLDFGDTVHEIPHEYVWGCNFSIRKNILVKIGGFHPDSVPQDLIKYRGDGESAVSFAVRDLGLKAIYNPKASVYHVVSSNRLTVDYIYQRAFNQGVSNSYTSIRKNRMLSDQMQYTQPSDKIHDAVDRGLVDGFNYHQQMVQADGKLLEWVLRDNYFGESGMPQ